MTDESLLPERITEARFPFHATDRLKIETSTRYLSPQVIETILAALARAERVNRAQRYSCEDTFHSARMLPDDSATWISVADILGDST